jgi:hypothetical protein
MKYLPKTILASLIVLLISCDVDQNQDETSHFAQENIKWPSLADTPWPIYNHDVQNTNRSQFAGPEATPSIVADVSFNKLLKASFTVDDADNLFLTAASGVYSVSTAFLDTTLLFQMPVVSYNYSTPIYTDDLALISINWEGELVKYTTGTNEFNYSVQLGDNSWINPIIDLNGNVLVAGMNMLFKVDGSGTTVWEQDYVELNSGALSPDGDIAYFSDNTTIYGIDVESGNELNTYSADYVFYPTISNDSDLFFNDISDNSVTCLDPSLNMKWKYNYGSSAGYDLAWDSGTLDYDGNYYTTGGSENEDELLSFDYEGELRWRTSLIHDQRAALLSDINNNIYVCGLHFSDGNETSYISSINSTGNLLWSIELPTLHSYEQPMLLSDGRIVIPAMRYRGRNLLILE